MRSWPALAWALLLAGCGSGSQSAPEQTTDRPDAVTLEQPAPPPTPTPTPDQMAGLRSKDCGEVVQLYLAALGHREWSRAALVWNDPAIDAARLEAVFGGYKELRLEGPDPAVEGAAGSLYCTVSGKLDDAKDRAKPPIEGTMLLRRVNDVPGATPEQLRWTLRSSTFVEQLERSDRAKP